MAEFGDNTSGVQQLNDGYLYAGGFSGSDPDARLDNTLSAASDGDTIYLENVVYTTDRTISKAVELIGTGGSFFGSEIDATYTFDDRANIVNINRANELTFNNGPAMITQSSLLGGGTVTVADDSFRYVNNHFGDVTFQSGTSNGIVDSCVKTTVTDNGSNTIGDIG